MTFERVHLQAFVLSLLALLIGGSGPARAQEQTFVCLGTNGAAGDSVDANHPGWIDAYGLDHGGTHPPSASFTPTDVSILKGTDSASVRLHQLLAEGIVLPKVVIDVCSSSGGPQACYYKLVLQNVNVSQLDLAGSACVDTATSCTPAQTESVSLRFEKVSWIHEGPGGISSYCWDTQTFASCTVPTATCTP